METLFKLTPISEVDLTTLKEAAPYFIINKYGIHDAVSWLSHKQSFVYRSGFAPEEYIPFSDVAFIFIPVSEKKAVISENKIDQIFNDCIAFDELPDAFKYGFQNLKVQIKLSLSPSNEQEKENRNWEEDFSNENGNYECYCIRCCKSFFGHKRRVVCKVCF